MKITGVMAAALLALAAFGRDVRRHWRHHSRPDLFADLLATHAKTGAALGWRVAVV